MIYVTCSPINKQAVEEKFLPIYADRVTIDVRKDCPLDVIYVTKDKIRNL